MGLWFADSPELDPASGDVAGGEMSFWTHGSVSGSERTSGPWVDFVEDFAATAC